MSDIIDILKQVGAVITDSHFVYTSGKHGSVYINKDAVYPHTKETSAVGRMMAKKFANTEVDVVVGPALGGIILSQWTAYHLSQIKGKEILGIYTEKDTDSNQILRRGYDHLVKGKNVLVVASHNSLRAVMKYVEKISDNDIINVEIPYGGLIEYGFDDLMKLIGKKLV